MTSRDQSEVHMDVLKRQLERSAVFIDAIGGLLAASTFTGSARCEAAAGMCAIAFEHSESMRLLVSAGLPTSGIALLRLQYEALVRAAWLVHAASDDQVSRSQAPLNLESQQAAKKLPSVKDMLTDLCRDGPRGQGRLLTRFRDRHWDGLNSYVHGGIHPLRRTSDGYPVTLLCDLLKNSNSLSMLTGLVWAELAADPEVATRLVALTSDFADCVTTLEPFPDG